MQRHIAIYARVSTTGQDLRSQLPDLQRWADSGNPEGLPIVWYTDKVTGKTMRRPAWQRLEDAMRAGKVARLVVWRMDRLGRQLSGMALLFDELQRLGVVLVSLRDGVDLGTAAGRMLAGVLASMAVFETELRAERILAGQAAARAEGKRWGGSKPGRKLPGSPTDEQRATVLRMAADGASKSAMARATRLSRPAVYRVLAAGT